MERELKEIKLQLKSSSDPARRLDTTTESSGTSSHAEADNMSQSSLKAQVPPEPKLSERLTSKTLGDVELDPSSISGLLQECDLSIFSSKESMCLPAKVLLTLPRTISLDTRLQCLSG